MGVLELDKLRKLLNLGKVYSLLSLLSVYCHREETCHNDFLADPKRRFSMVSVLHA